MGRKSKPNAKKKKTNNQGKLSEQKKTFTTDDLLDKAEEYVDTFQFDLAERFCSRARQQDPTSVRAHEMSGILKLELGDFDGAKAMFKIAIDLCPDRGHEKYMYMGQIHTGSESVQYFMRGIELMKNYMVDMAAQAEAIAGSSETTVTPMDISSAYCSVAEIYLTDECFNEEAEVRCRECLDNALKECAENAEAHHLYASYWMSKDDTEKALDEMKKGLSLWLPQLKEASTEETGASNAETDEVSLCALSYPARLNATKILIELQQYETASEILELLLDEEDEVVETWYLLGWVNHLQGEEFKNNARYYLGKAQQTAKKTRCEDKELIKHVTELLDELGGPVDDLPEEDGSDEEGDGDMDVPEDSDEESSKKPANGHESMDQ